MALFEFKFTDSQFRQLLDVERQKLTVMKEIRDSVQVLAASTTEGFAAVGRAISELQIPDSPPGEADDAAVEGTIVARYKFSEDQADVSYDIEVRDLKSAKGSAVGAEDIDISAESNSPNLQASVSNQTLSADGKSVKATVTLTGNPGGMQNADLAVVTYRGTNRDTGNVVAADSDEFETGPGEASIGTIDSPVPLTEVPTGGGTGTGTGGGETGGTTGGTGETGGGTTTDTLAGGGGRV